MPDKSGLPVPQARLHFSGHTPTAVVIFVVFNEKKSANFWRDAQSKVVLDIMLRILRVSAKAVRE